MAQENDKEVGSKSYPPFQVNRFIRHYWEKLQRKLHEHALSQKLVRHGMFYQIFVFN